MTLMRGFEVQSLDMVGHGPVIHNFPARHPKSWVTVPGAAMTP
jgi:hypothetical protein